MVIDRFILEMADEYQPIGTLHQRLVASTCCPFISFGSVFFRVCYLIQKGLLEYKYERLSRGGAYVVCRRNRRHSKVGYYEK